MKKTLDICSLLCGVTALLSLVFGIRAMSGGSFFVGLRMFGMAERGTFMGFIGNLLGIAVGCLGFGSMAVCGFSGSVKLRKNGFIYGLVMTALCIISAIAALIARDFTVGDIFIAALPAVYTFAMLKTA
ncbi:MAG: hypothetical protein NC120_00020 [Ruminococcus sp.]|nr:hypothetical protein [Ruminococcus sp.]